MNQERTQTLKDLIARLDIEGLRQALADLHPADAAEALSYLEPVEVARYIELVGPERALTAFEFSPFELQRETLPHLSRRALAQLVNLMSPDDRADLMEELDEGEKERILSLLIKSERQDVLKLLNYPEGSAGAYMTTNHALLSGESTAAAALAQVRLQAPAKETIYYLYVVDQARRLIGFISLRKLLMAPPGRKVGEVMNTQAISAKVGDRIEDVVNLMLHYDFLALPVVDDQDRLVGIITYDDIFDIMANEATEDMYHLANLDTDEKVDSPILRSVKLRAPWLFINLGTGLVAAFMVSLFSGAIQEVVALASLMTIVALLGGNAGNQSLTVVVRAMALGEVKLAEGKKVVFKEFCVGVLNGLVVGMTVGLVAYFWYGNPWLGLILWLAMTGNLMIAGTMGALVPMTMRRLKLDPALGSSIFVTTATDVGGFFMFLGLATILLHRLAG